MDSRIQRDLARPDLPREKVLAALIRLLESTFIRVGNEEYARENRSFGLTTMRNRHVDVSGSTLRFRFRGKSGKEHTIPLTDRRLASIVQRQVPREALSRVIAYDMFGSFALAPVGYALGGLLAAPLGATTTLFGAGIVLAALAAVLWAIPGIRALRSPV